MIVKIWGINAGKKDTSKGIYNAMEYIKDDSKVIGEEVLDAKDYEFLNSEDDITRVLDYMQNENKTKKLYVSGYMCDPSTALEEFVATKEQNLSRVHKELSDDTGYQAFHIVQSFPDDLDISDEEVHQCGIELCRKLGKYQAVIASHVHPVTDEDGTVHGNCKHNHIIINSHMNPEFIDPQRPNVIKYHDCKETYMQLRAYNDEIALAHGFPIIDEKELENSYSWYETKMINEGKSWKKRVCLDIKAAMQRVSSWEEFKKMMEKQGYSIREGKYETYTTPDGQKARGSSLGEEYTRTYLESYWAFRKSIETTVENEITHNQHALSGEALINILANNSLNYYIKLPRINKTTGQKYAFLFHLSEAESEKILDIYIKDSQSYAIYRNKNTLMGYAYGNVIKEVLAELYVKEYYKKAKEQRIEEVLAAKREEMVYYQEGWLNSKTGSPYNIGLYDEDGNKRSLLEQIFILAVVILTNEAPDYLLEGTKAASVSLSAPVPSKRVENVIEALKISREEDIKTLDELNARLLETGKQISILQKKIRQNTHILDKMRPIEEALLKDASLMSPEREDDFQARFNYSKQLDLTLHDELYQKSMYYQKLKKVQYQAKLAMDKDYCYGRKVPEKLQEYVKQKE